MPLRSSGCSRKVHGRFALLVYYLAVAAFVLLTIRGFFRRNQKQYRKFLPCKRGLIERPAPLTFPSSFPLRIWNRDKKRTYFSGYQYLLLAKPQRRRYSKNRVRETQRSSQP